MHPLRDRTGDIPLLVKAFIEAYNKEFRKNVSGVSPKIMKRLEKHDWPGNIRELKNTIERAMILSTMSVIDFDDMPMDILDDNGKLDSDDEHILNLSRNGIHIEKMEEDLVRQALKLANGNQTRAGRYLGLNRDQIRYRIDKFKIDLKAFQENN